MARAVALPVVIGVVVAATVVLRPAPAQADAKSDQAQINQLGLRIAQDGDQVQQLVVRYDRAQAHQAAVTAALAAVQVHLASDRRAEARGESVLRQLALTSYMTGAGEDAALSLFETGDSSTQVSKQEYMRLASDNLDNAVDAVDLDKQKTQSAETRLRFEQAQADADVRQLADERQAAQAALTNDDALLAQAKGNLQALLAAAARQRQAAEEAEEEAMAAKAAQVKAAQIQAAVPVPVTFNPTPGSYADPLRGISALTPERIDQGVDYSGYGPIYAVGDGVVLSTVNGGWPGGTFITYRLSDGPASGLVVYAAEDIDPLVTVGQSVSSTTVLGTMYEGPDGIETGWADPSGDGVTMASDAGQFSGANSTAFGADFSELLASLGAPPGIPQNEPPTGSLPPGWPAW